MKFQLPFHSALLGWRKRGFSEKGVEMQDEKRDEKAGEMTFHCSFGNDLTDNRCSLSPPVQTLQGH